MSNVEETTIPFETVRVPNGDKPEGFEEVVSDGVEGKRTVTRNDEGQIVSDKTVNARNEVVYFGTKKEGDDVDSISSGTAGDRTISNTKETVSTPESPQEDTQKDTPQNVQEYSDGFEPPKTYNPVLSQGRSEESNHKSKVGFNVNAKALKTAALEAARLLVFAVPGILITVFTNNPELGGSLGATILLVLKSLDRGIHEDKTTAATGILPF